MAKITIHWQQIIVEKTPYGRYPTPFGATHTPHLRAQLLDDLIHYIDHETSKNLSEQQATQSCFKRLVEHMKEDVKNATPEERKIAFTELQRIANKDLWRVL